MNRSLLSVALCLAAACGSETQLSSLTMTGLAESLSPSEREALAPRLDGDRLDLSTADLVYRGVGYRVHAWVANLESVSVRVSAIEGKVHEVRIDAERMVCAAKSERDARTGQDPLAPEIDGEDFRAKGFIDCQFDGTQAVTRTYELNLDASDLFYVETHTGTGR